MNKKKIMGIFSEINFFYRSSKAYLRKKANKKINKELADSIEEMRLIKRGMLRKQPY